VRGGEIAHAVQPAQVEEAGARGQRFAKRRQPGNARQGAAPQEFRQLPLFLGGGGRRPGQCVAAVAADVAALPVDGLQGVIPQRQLLDRKSVV
jgi:hypothetical protein